MVISFFDRIIYSLVKSTHRSRRGNGLMFKYKFFSKHFWKVGEVQISVSWASEFYWSLCVDHLACWLALFLCNDPHRINATLPSPSPHHIDAKQSQISIFISAADLLISNCGGGRREIKENDKNIVTWFELISRNWSISLSSALSDLKYTIIGSWSITESHIIPCHSVISSTDWWGVILVIPAEIWTLIWCHDIPISFLSQPTPEILKEPKQNTSPRSCLYILDRPSDQWFVFFVSEWDCLGESIAGCGLAALTSQDLHYPPPASTKDCHSNTSPSRSVCVWGESNESVHPVSPAQSNPAQYKLIIKPKLPSPSTHWVHWEPGLNLPWLLDTGYKDIAVTIDLDLGQWWLVVVVTVLGLTLEQVYLAELSQ